MRGARLGVILGGALVAGGAFLPWATVGLISLDGMRGDGVFALGLGIAIAFIGAVTPDRGASTLVAVGLMLLSGLAFALYVWKLVTIGAVESEGLIVANVGTGIFVGIAGSVVAFLATVGLGMAGEEPAPKRTDAREDALRDLATLADRRDAGEITAEEYETAKREIIDRL